MSECYACTLVAPCTPYRLGGRGTVLVLLCEPCGSDLEALMADWLARVRETPRQVGLWEEAS